MQVLVTEPISSPGAASAPHVCMACLVSPMLLFNWKGKDFLKKSCIFSFFLPPLRVILKIKCWRHSPRLCAEFTTMWRYFHLESGGWSCAVSTRPCLFRNNLGQALLWKKLIDSNGINDDFPFLFFFPAQTPEAFFPSYTKNFIKHQDPQD